MSRLPDTVGATGRSRRRIPVTRLFLAALAASALPLAAAPTDLPPSTVPARDAAPARRSAEEGRPFETCFNAKEYAAAAQSWTAGSR